jgi:hypothetical protein
MKNQLKIIQLNRLTNPNSNVNTTSTNESNTSK